MATPTFRAERGLAVDKTLIDEAKQNGARLYINAGLFVEITFAKLRDAMFESENPSTLCDVLRESATSKIISVTFYKA